MKRNGALLLLALVGAGCAGSESVLWKRHVTLRGTGRGHKAMALSTVQPHDVTARAPRSDEYVGLRIERMFFRSLAGISSGAKVLVVVRVHGLGRDVSLIASGEADAKGSVEITQPLVVEAVPYSAAEVGIEVLVRALGSGESENIGGRLSGAGDVVHRVHPYKRSADTAQNIAASLLAGLHARSTPPWRYELTLHPRLSPKSGSEELLLAGRSFMVLLPPSGPLAKRLNLRTLTTQLRTRTGQLFWKKADEPYTDSPYWVLSIDRHKRLPPGVAEHDRLEDELDTLVSRGKFDDAEKAFRALTTTLEGTKVLSEGDRAIALRMLGLRRERLSLYRARAGKDAAAAEHARKLADGVRDMQQSLRKALDEKERALLQAWERDAAAPAP